VISRTRRRIGADIWPGFVDALSTLLLLIIFLLSLFVLVQFFLSQTLSGQDEALKRLNQQVSELGELLSMERQASADLRLNVAQLSASLQSATVKNDDLSTRIRDLKAGLSAANESRQRAQAEIARLTAAAAAARGQTDQARQKAAGLERQLAALRQQLAQLQAALESSESRDRESKAVIADLGRRLNVALAAKVHELAGYRSEFFGRLRQAIGNRADVKIVGDRFVFQSEVLFASGSAELGEEGKAQLDTLARALLAIARKIPPDLKWVLRVDGHTDAVPINNEKFRSNWELSAARALSVVHYLVGQGVPPNRLAAAGFGEFQPIAPGNTPADRRRNRRIEFKLTER